LTDTIRIKGRVIRVVRCDLPSKPSSVENGRKRPQRRPAKPTAPQERDYPIRTSMQGLSMRDRTFEGGGMSERRRKSELAG